MPVEFAYPSLPELPQRRVLVGGSKRLRAKNKAARKARRRNRAR